MQLYMIPTESGSECTLYSPYIDPISQVSLNNFIQSTLYWAEVVKVLIMVVLVVYYIQ